MMLPERLSASPARLQDVQRTAGLGLPRADRLHHTSQVWVPEKRTDRITSVDPTTKATATAATRAPSLKTVP